MTIPSAEPEGRIGSGHAQRDEQSDEAGEDRNDQRDLKGERSRVGVDADDLVLDLLWVVRRAALSSWVLVITSASSSSTCRDLLLARPAGARCSSFAMLVKVKESVASMMAPANASPNDSPNEPAAEFTPAASLTRSSEIGESV